MDGVKGDQLGGTGERSDWSRVPIIQTAGKKAILAGGLSAKNIADAYVTGADVLDINSSLEISLGVRLRCGPVCGRGRACTRPPLVMRAWARGHET